MDLFNRSFSEDFVFDSLKEFGFALDESAENFVKEFSKECKLIANPKTKTLKTENLNFESLIKVFKTVCEMSEKKLFKDK